MSLEDELKRQRREEQDQARRDEEEQNKKQENERRENERVRKEREAHWRKFQKPLHDAIRRAIKSAISSQEIKKHGLEISEPKDESTDVEYVAYTTISTTKTVLAGAEYRYDGGGHPIAIKRLLYSQDHWKVLTLFCRWSGKQTDQKWFTFDSEHDQWFESHIVRKLQEKIAAHLLSIEGYRWSTQQKVEADLRVMRERISFNVRDNIEVTFKFLGMVFGIPLLLIILIVSCIHLSSSP